MEIIYKCPVCNTTTIGTFKRTCGGDIICPNCLKTGRTVIMLEQSCKPIKHMGDGLYQKP